MKLLYATFFVKFNLIYFQELKKEAKNSTYDRLKSSYEQSLAEMSETIVLTKEYDEARKKWASDYFKTKVEQTDYFECLCGVESYQCDDEKVINLFIIIVLEIFLEKISINVYNFSILLNFK